MPESSSPAFIRHYIFDATLDYADFKGAYFENHANLTCNFTGIADFKFAHLDGTAYLSGAVFNGTAYFGGAVFNDTADFSGTVFNDWADFSEAGFNDWADFNGAVFNDTADLSGAVFNGTADLSGAVFNDTADLSGAVFNDTADFRGTVFNITGFSDAQFNKEAHFEEAQFAGKASFDNVRFKEVALFDGADFKGELSFTKAKYNKLYVRWYNITSFVYDDTAYMALMKNFKDLGYYEDYDSCYFQYRSAHRNHPWPAVREWEQFLRKTFIDYPLEWFNGYGTKPFNAALSSLGIVVIFAAFWWHIGLGGPKDKTREKLKDRTGESQQDDDEWLDRDIPDILAFSITVFLSGTKLFIDPPPLPRIEGKSRSMIRKAFILERLLGALFSVLFFIAISGTISRAY